MKISVLIATLNSMRTLKLCLQAIKAQDYSSELIEIMVIDGGSTDGTRELALAENCRLLDNHKVEPVSAKILGFKEASGDLLIHVDSDEVLTDKLAFRKRAQLFTEHPQIQIAFSAGYKNPPQTPFAAHYINEFGDPFSMYFYRLSRDHRFFLNDIGKTCKRIEDYEHFQILEVSGDNQPLMENAACGNTLRLSFFREHFSDIADKPWGPVHFFYHMQRFTRQFAVIKGDAIIHHSADSLESFLRKIKWRIRNNVYFADQLGKSGFSGRQQYAKSATKWRSYMYLIYAFTLVPTVIDAVYLCVTRREFGYLLHIPLTLYTASNIVLMYTFKLLGHRPQLKSYGG